MSEIDFIRRHSDGSPFSGWYHHTGCSMAEKVISFQGLLSDYRCWLHPFENLRLYVRLILAVSARWDDRCRLDGRRTNPMVSAPRRAYRKWHRAMCRAAPSPRSPIPPWMRSKNTSMQRCATAPIRYLPRARAERWFFSVGHFPSLVIGVHLAHCLAGTAGLRLFEMTNATYTDELLNSTRAYFGSLGLLFKSPDYQVRIISGTEEGLSGWTSTNMLTRQLLSSSTPPETYGVSDLGGEEIKAREWEGWLKWLPSRCQYADHLLFS